MTARDRIAALVTAIDKAREDIRATITPMGETHTSVLFEQRDRHDQWQRITATMLHADYADRLDAIEPDIRAVLAELSTLVDGAHFGDTRA